jgi:hypothetical protein
MTTSVYLLPHCLWLISHCKLSKMWLSMELKQTHQILLILAKVKTSVRLLPTSDIIGKKVVARAVKTNSNKLSCSKLTGTLGENENRHSCLEFDGTLSSHSSNLTRIPYLHKQIRRPDVTKLTLAGSLWENEDQPCFKIQFGIF